MLQNLNFHLKLFKINRWQKEKKFDNLNVMFRKSFKQKYSLRKKKTDELILTNPLFKDKIWKKILQLFKI